jgi:hypothetical protein
MELTGRTRVSLTKSIRKLRDRKQVYICEWERQPEGKQGGYIVYYALGDQPDAKRLAPLSLSERNKLYRKRHKAVIALRRYTKHHTALGVWAGLGG